MKKIIYIAFCGVFIPAMMATFRTAGASGGIDASITEKATKDSKVSRIVAELKEQSVPPHEVIQAAEKGLPRFLHPNMDPSLLRSWGLVSEDINSASLGNPFRLYVIKSDILQKYQKGDAAYSLISKTDTWYCPVKVADEIKLVLTVAKRKNAYAAGSLGYVLLAPQLNNILRSWPSQNYGIVLVEAYPFQNYFIVIDEKINNITRIETTPNALTPDYSVLDTVDNIAQKLKLELEKHPRGVQKNIGDIK